MDEAAHIPGQLWSGYGQSVLAATDAWFISPKVGGVPSPQGQLVYFNFNPASISTAGLVTLCIPVSTPHGGLIAPSTPNMYVVPIKSWWVAPSEHVDPQAVYEFNPSIPIGFDTNTFTFGLMNGDPYGNNRCAMTYSYMVTVLPLH